MSDDSVSGALLDGAIMTDVDVLGRVRSDGSLAIVRGPAQRLRRSDWAAQFIEFARSRGMRVSIRDTGRMVLVLDIDWDGWAPADDAERDADHDEPASRAAHPSRGRGPRLVR